MKLHRRDFEGDGNAGFRPRTGLAIRPVCVLLSRLLFPSSVCEAPSYLRGGGLQGPLHSGVSVGPCQGYTVIPSNNDLGKLGAESLFIMIVSIVSVSLGGIRNPVAKHQGGSVTWPGMTHRPLPSGPSARSVLLCSSSSSRQRLYFDRDVLTYWPSDTSVLTTVRSKDQGTFETTPLCLYPGV